MRKIAVLAAVGVLSVGAFTASEAEARNSRRAGAAIAAGIVGVAAGALLASAASPAYARPAPVYHYPGYAPAAYGYSAPVVSYDYEEVPVYRPYRVKRVVRYYEEPRRVHRKRHVVRHYHHDYGHYAPVRSRSVTYSYGSPYYGGYYDR